MDRRELFLTQRVVTMQGLDGIAFAHFMFEKK